MIKNCLNCKHCIEGGLFYYDFKCQKKRIRFNYNLKAIIRGFICMFYEQKEVKESD